MPSSNMQESMHVVMQAVMQEVMQGVKQQVMQAVMQESEGCVALQAVGGSGWSAGLGSNLGWALSSFGGAKAKGQTFFFLLHWLGNPVTGRYPKLVDIASHGHVSTPLHTPAGPSGNTMCSLTAHSRL